MKIVTLYDQNDLIMRRLLDRYLTQLSQNGNVLVWNDEQIPPGEAVAAVLESRLRQADLILLLISQDFIASPDCYKQALIAVRLCSEDPKKKMAVVSLRPNSIEDTPFKDLPRLPPGNVCISQYRDPEQGYWDTYQGIKTILNPEHRYKIRPKIISWRTTAIVSAVLLVWSLFVLLLPVIYPQEGLRIVPEPCRGDADSVFYYKIYKLDAAAQSGILLNFTVTPEDTLRYGQLLDFSYLEKIGDANWPLHQTMTMAPNEAHWDQDRDRFFAQCVQANFNRNDQGEYRFQVGFNRPLDKNGLAAFRGRLSCGFGPCNVTESNCENVGAFSPFHILYFSQTRFFVSVLIFGLITVLAAAGFILKKTSSYAAS